MVGGLGGVMAVSSGWLRGAECGDPNGLQVVCV